MLSQQTPIFAAGSPTTERAGSIGWPSRSTGPRRVPFARRAWVRWVLRLYEFGFRGSRGLKIRGSGFSNLGVLALSCTKQSEPPPCHIVVLVLRLRFYKFMGVWVKVYSKGLLLKHSRFGIMGRKILGSSSQRCKQGPASVDRLQVDEENHHAEGRGRRDG